MKWMQRTYFTGRGPACTADFFGFPAIHGIKQPRPDYRTSRMNRGFYTIMAAQFFSSLADNALFFVAIDLLTAMKAPPSVTPLLKLSFVLFYVLLAALVGAFADALPKGRVMF